MAQQAWAVLYAAVPKQALFLAFLDDFWRLAWLFVLLLPCVLLLGRRAAAGDVPAH